MEELLAQASKDLRMESLRTSQRTEMGIVTRRTPLPGPSPDSSS